MTSSTSSQGSPREGSIISKEKHLPLNHGRSASEQRTTSELMLKTELRRKASSASPRSSNNLQIRGTRASNQGSIMLEPSPLGQRPLSNSSGPDRSLKHSDPDLVENEEKDDEQLQRHNSLKIHGEMPPPKTFKRKEPLDTMDLDGESFRKVRARNVDITHSSPAPDTSSNLDNLIPKIIKGIETLAEEKYRYCNIASKMHDLKNFMDCKANKVTKSSHDRYAEVCEEVKGCNEKVKEQRSILLQSFKDLLDTQEFRSHQAPETSDGEMSQSDQNKSEAPSEAHVIKSEPDEEIVMLINEVEGSGGDDVQGLVQAKLAAFEDLLPALIEQAISRRQESAEKSLSCSPLQSNEIDADLNQTNVEPEKSTELEQLQHLIVELKQDSQKKTQEIEELRRILHNLQENMSVQERITVFNTTAILRHEGSLLKFNAEESA